MQSWFCHRRRVKSAFKCKSGFHWRVIKSADHEIFAAVTLRPVREFLVLIRETLDNFRPRNISANVRRGRQRTKRDCGGDYWPKTEFIGPPIKISMGKRFHSYS